MKPKTRWDGWVEGEDNPNRHASLLRLSEWGPRPIDWLWEPLIPRRKVTLLVGDQELGKSFFALDLAARLSRGDAIPPAGILGGPADTLILSGDDDLDDTLFPRLEGLDAYLDRIYTLAPWGGKGVPDGLPQISLADSVESLHDAARQMSNCRLIVIDPITAFIEGLATNSHAQVRRMIQRLTMLAKAHDAAVLIITHHRKDAGRSVLHRTIGSLAFTLAARVVLTLVSDPTTVGRRLLLPAKMNLLPLSACPGRAFAIAEGRVRWDPEPVTTRPDELQRMIARGLATSERMMDIAHELRQLLTRGPLPSLEVHQWAAQKQIPRMLLFQAKSFAGIEARRDHQAQRWCWEVGDGEENSNAGLLEEEPDSEPLGTS